jgi:hypothetical protein
MLVSEALVTVAWLSMGSPAWRLMADGYKTKGRTGLREPTAEPATPVLFALVCLRHGPAIANFTRRRGRSIVTITEYPNDQEP